MMQRVTAVGRRLLIGHATVVAYLALLLASSGAAYAAATIGSAEVINNSLKSVDMADGLAVGGVDVINDSVTGADVKEATLNGSVKKIRYDVTNTVDAFPTWAVVGPFTLVLECRVHDALESPNQPNDGYLRLWTQGPVHSVYAHGVSRAEGGGVPEDFLFESVSGSNGQYPLWRDGPYDPNADELNIKSITRAGTITVTSGTAVAQFQFHSVVTITHSNTNPTTRCQVFGTAVVGV